MTETGFAWKNDTGWACVAFEECIEGSGETLDEAVNDMAACYTLAIIANMPEGSTVIIDKVVSLKLLGPPEEDLESKVRVVYDFEVVIPRSLTPDEEMVYHAQTKPILNVDEEYRPFLWNLPLEWQ